MALEFEWDPEHSVGEVRLVLLAQSSRGRLLGDRPHARTAAPLVLL
jgi:hypothetical protein